MAPTEMAPADMMVEYVRQLLELDAAKLSTTLASLSQYAEARSEARRASSDSSSDCSGSSSGSSRDCGGRSTGACSGRQDPDDGVTFVIHNLPRSMLPEKMLQLLEALGVLGACDLLYVPTRSYQLRGGSRRAAAVGYGFVHFVCEDAACAFNAALHCKRREGSHTKQTIKVRRTDFSAVVGEFEKKRPACDWVSEQLRGRLGLPCGDLDGPTSCAQPALTEAAVVC